MRPLLGYYKYQLKNRIFQSYIRLNLRSKGHRIGRRVLLHSANIGGNCQIKEGAVIGPNATLAGNNIIGAGAKISNITVGVNTQIDSSVICTGNGQGRIVIGKECYIGIYNILDWSDDITIGDFVQIAGPTTALWTHSGARMCFNSIPLRNTSPEFRPTAAIVIESNVYIGGNCTIYPGITISHHSVVAPNSVVTKNVDPYTMVGGVPARKIKDLART